MLIGLGFQKRLMRGKRGMTQFLANQLKARVKSAVKGSIPMNGIGAMKMDDRPLDGGRVGQRRIMPLKFKF